MITCICVLHYFNHIGDTTNALIAERALLIGFAIMDIYACIWEGFVSFRIVKILQKALDNTIFDAHKPLIARSRNRILLTHPFFILCLAVGGIFNIFFVLFWYDYMYGWYIAFGQMSPLVVPIIAFLMFKADLLENIPSSRKLSSSKGATVNSTESRLKGLYSERHETIAVQMSQTKGENSETTTTNNSSPYVSDTQPVSTKKFEDCPVENRLNDA